MNRAGAPTTLDPLPALATALAGTRRRGFAHVPGALSGQWRRALLTEVAAREFSPVPTQVGKVRQRADELAVRVGDPGLPVMTALAAALRRAVITGTVGIQGLGWYRPNEATYQRYRGADAGISPHRDFSNQRLLVAVFTLAGHAPFRIVADRAGTEEVAAWQMRPGDLCLLRGPGFNGEPDGRPLHTVGPPRHGERLSLGFRMVG